MQTFDLDDLQVGAFALHPSDILMQFTGLKDKNGRDIYEGDIVQFASEPTYKRTWSVIFQDGAFGLSDGIGVRFLISHQNLERERLKQVEWPSIEEGEIIGNIYKNPERLG